MSDAEFLDIVDNFLLSGYNSPSPSNDKDSTVPFGWFIDVPVESESLGISSTSGTLNGSAPGFKVRVPASERESATSLDRDNPTVWVVDLIGPSSISQLEAAPLDLDSEAHDFEAVNYDDTFQVYCAESSNTNRQYAQNKAALALSNESVSDTSSSSLRLAPNLRVAKKRKRKFDEMVKDRDSGEDLKAGELEEPATLSSSSRWERVETRETLPYSRQTRNGTRGFKYRYRCDLCYDNNKKHVCDKEGDMKRHLQSIDHSPKSFTCTNSGCGKAFTRKDGLKRHRSSCRHDTSRSTS